MARITKSDSAPNDLTRVTLGSFDFEVPFETDNESVVADARANPFLSVEADEPAADPTAAVYDPNDPQRNPAADHLSALASDEAVQAADANEAAIRRAAYPDAPEIDPADAVAPSVRESVEATLRLSGVDEAAELPFQDAEETPAPFERSDTPAPPVVTAPTFTDDEEND